MAKPNRKRTSLRQQVRHTLHRLGMQTRAREVVDELAKYGIIVSAGFVERVRFEELKGREAVGGGKRTSPRVGKRYHMQKIPRKRPRGR